jgi:hypothetical protein
LEVLLSDHRIVNASQPERGITMLEAHTLIYQHPDTFSAKQIGNQSRIRPVIVIPKNCEYSMLSTQSPKHFRAGRGKSSVTRNIVAGKSDHVGLQPVRRFDGADNLV